VQTPELKDALLELVRRTATDLPADAEKAIRDASEQETVGSAARSAIDTILENVALARKNSTPICQDTGTPIFYVLHPVGWSTRALVEQIGGAVAEATARSYLRPNAVHSVTGTNTNTNVGEGVPTVHCQEWDEDYLKVDLMLKGGGCENVSAHG